MCVWVCVRVCVKEILLRVIYASFTIFFLIYGILNHYVRFTTKTELHRGYWDQLMS